MLSVFPELLDFSFFAPLIIRVVGGFVFLNLGILKLSSEKERWQMSLAILKLKPVKTWVYILGLIEFIGGIMLILGFFTQVVALIFAIIALAELMIERFDPAIIKRGVAFYLLIFALSLSLLFSGAGALAFDLPL